MDVQARLRAITLTGAYARHYLHRCLCAPLPSQVYAHAARQRLQLARLGQALRKVTLQLAQAALRPFLGRLSRAPGLPRAQEGSPVLATTQVHAVGVSITRPIAGITALRGAAVCRQRALPTGRAQQLLELAQPHMCKGKGGRARGAEVAVCACLRGAWMHSVGAVGCAAGDAAASGCHRRKGGVGRAVGARLGGCACDRGRPVVCRVDAIAAQVQVAQRAGCVQLQRGQQREAAIGVDLRAHVREGGGGTEAGEGANACSQAGAKMA